MREFSLSSRPFSKRTYLWLAVDHDQEIQRINLATRKIEFTILFADIFSDIPSAGVASYSGRTYQVLAMQPDLVDDELLAVASTQAPLLVLRGHTRVTRFGSPGVSSIVPNSDGSFWTELYRFKISANGVEVLDKPSEVVPRLIAPLGVAVIDELNVIRRPTDLRRIGLLNVSSLSSLMNIVYRQDTGRGYIGGGRFGYSIAAFDPERLIVTEQWGANMGGPGAGAGPGRLINIGSEGFAAVFGEPWDGNFGLGAGGDILFVPLDYLQPIEGLVLPASRPASGTVRYFAVPVQGATVDRSSGRVLFSLASSLPGIGNSILPFRPADGRFGDPVWAGSEPYVGAVPADGRFFYLSLAGSRTVKRFRLPDLVEDSDFVIYDFAFGWDTSGGFPQNVNVLDVPGAPSTTIAVQRFGGLGVAIFDDGVERPKTTFQAVPGYRMTVDSVQFSPSGRWLFGISNTGSDFPFGRFAVTLDGLVPEIGETGLIDFYGGFGNLLRCGEALCLTTNGMVIDPFEMKQVRVLEGGPFPNHGLLSLDVEGDRVYLYLPGGSINGLRAGIHSFAISTGRRTGSLPGIFPGSDMQLLASGELMLSGPEGIALVPTQLIQ